MILLDKIAS